LKLIHLSDLHLGKKLNEFSLLEDQRYILGQILGMIRSEAPDAVILAGDIYDKAVPPAEAVSLFDDFLSRLSETGVSIFMISGNHDSAERLSFARQLLSRSELYVSPVYNGQPSRIDLQDEYGTVHFFLLPFIKPAHVRHVHPDETIESYTDAVRIAVGEMNADPAERNVLVTHQFVTGSVRCESEEINVGGADNVDATVFDAFDYVALGHLHNPQQVTRPTIRYCGTPLKYSFSEASVTKSVTVIEMAEKGQIAIRTLDLAPLRELSEIRGSFRDLTDPDFYSGTTYADDYMHITLTDENDIPDAIGQLRRIYHNVMKLDYDNKRTRQNSVLQFHAVKSKTPMELFEDFYQQQNNASMSEPQKLFLEGLIEKIWEENAQ